jgi:hypothetical protein
MPFSQPQEILFDGSKYMPTKDINLKIKLVNHGTQMCLELIVQLESIQIRKYLDMKKLISNLDLTLINQQFLVKKNNALLNKVKFEYNKTMRGLATAMVVETLLNRIEISPHSDDIYFRIFPKDIDITIMDGYFDQRLNFELRNKPRHLRPYVIVKTPIAVDSTTLSLTDLLIIDTIDLLNTSPRTTLTPLTNSTSSSDNLSSKSNSTKSTKSTHSHRKLRVKNPDKCHSDSSTESPCYGSDESEPGSEIKKNV